MSTTERYSVINDAAAAYGWDRVVEALLPGLNDALVKSPRAVDCPFHNGKKDFRFPKDFASRGVSLCSCGYRHVVQMMEEIDGIQTADAYERIASLVGVDFTNPVVDRSKVKTAEERSQERLAMINSTEKVQRRRLKAKSLWDESLPLADPAAAVGRMYLRKRGLAIPRGMSTPYVRFHPSLAYWKGEPDRSNQDRYPGGERRSPQQPEYVGDFPALVFLVRSADLGQSQTIHRIYLDEQGNKLDVEDPKKMMPLIVKERTIGLHIPIYISKKNTSRVHVAEGPETAWAIALTTGETTYSAICADFLEKQLFERDVNEVWIWADKDRSKTGEFAAQALVNMLLARGIKVVVLLPKASIPEGEKSLDWLDVYSSQDWRGKDMSYRRDFMLSQAASEGLKIAI